MKKITIIGKGNVGTHLFKILSTKDIEVCQVDSRTLKNLSDNQDLIIIAVSDSSIGEVAKRISFTLHNFEGTVVHTAGSVNMDILSPYFKNFGVAYPMQTFTKEIEIPNYSEIPFFIEANNKFSLKEIKSVVTLISNNIYELSSEKRLKLHAASVFSCNFSNALYMMACDILKEIDLPFDILAPLIRQTSEKAISTGNPMKCQTGPARRGDTVTIDKHLGALSESEREATIYKMLSEYIYDKFSKGNE